MATELHVRIVNALWRGLRNLEIMDELCDPRGLNLTLNDVEEREIENHINRLRNEIAEARRLAPEAAEQMFRDGFEWREVIDALSRPHLLTSLEIVGVASKAQEKVQQGAEGVA